MDDLQAAPQPASTAPVPPVSPLTPTAPLPETKEPGPGIEDTAVENSDEEEQEQEAAPVPTKSSTAFLNPSEKRWMAILLIGLIAVGGVFYHLMRGGLPSKSVYQATLSPSFPIKGAKISVENVDLRWKETGSGKLFSDSGNATLFPEAVIDFGAHSDGAVRLFFKDERDHQVGDTVNFEVRGSNAGEGGGRRVITCTEGMKSRMDYDDLRSRENSHWVLEIHEGTDPLGPITGFTLLRRIYIPWNLGPIKSTP